jgi:ABC-type Mn2+/Zn2+ transport system permease subunit
MPLLALKLLHVALAFGFVAGLIGRFLVLRRASRAADVETAYETQTAHLRVG